MHFPIRRAGLTAASAAFVAALISIPLGASAQTGNPAASAFGVSVAVAGQNVIPPTPAVSVATPPGDATDTVIDLPAAPVIVNGTLTATANAHQAANIASGLTVVQQAVAGPYNGRGLAEIEGAEVLVGVAGLPAASLLSAAAIRAEAAVVCGATPRYTATSEIIDLDIAGNDVPLNAPLSDLIDQLSDALTTSGLNAVADVQRNVVTQIAGGGIRVEALVVTVLSAVGATPLAQVRLGHAEVTAAACPPAATVTPNAPACSDTRDNDGDGKIDIADPGCHSDNNATNVASFVPSDNDESDELSRAALLPRTGAETTIPLALAGLVTIAAAARRLRRS